MRAFDEYHDVSFKGMEERKELKERTDGVFPMGLLIDMEKLRELIEAPCPQCKRQSLAIDHIEFEKNWNTVEEFHQGVSSDHVLIGGHYHVICGGVGCDFENIESIPVELFNKQPETTWSLDGDEQEKPAQPMLVIEHDLSEDELEQVKQDDFEYCEENDIEYDEEDLESVVNYL